jgi:hypothetical protein
VRRLGTIAMSSREYAVRARLARPISISVMVVLVDEGVLDHARERCYDGCCYDG